MLRRRFGIVVVVPVGAGGCDVGGGTLVAVPTSTDSGATFVVLRARFVGDSTVVRSASSPESAFSGVDWRLA